MSCCVGANEIEHAKSGVTRHPDLHALVLLYNNVSTIVVVMEVVAQDKQLIVNELCHKAHSHIAKGS